MQRRPWRDDPILQFPRFAHEAALCPPPCGQAKRKRLTYGRRFTWAASAAPAAGAEPDLPCQRAALLRIVRRHHGIVGRQFPALAILLGRQAVSCADMPLQHLLLAAAFET